MTAETTMLGRIETELAGLKTSVQDVRERVIRIEERDITSEVKANRAAIGESRQETARVVAEIWKEIDDLKQAEARRQGAKGLFEFIAKNGPGFVTLTVIFILGIMASKGGLF